MSQATGSSKLGAGATAVALVLLSSRPGRQRPLWFALAALVIAAMAWSRTYLRVHWLSDVLARAALGTAVTLANFAIVHIALARPASRKQADDDSRSRFWPPGRLDAHEWGVLRLSRCVPAILRVPASFFV